MKAFLRRFWTWIGGFLTGGALGVIVWHCIIGYAHYIDREGFDQCMEPLDLAYSRVNGDFTPRVEKKEDSPTDKVEMGFRA